MQAEVERLQAELAAKNATGDGGLAGELAILKSENAVFSKTLDTLQQEVTQLKDVLSIFLAVSVVRRGRRTRQQRRWQRRGQGVHPAIVEAAPHAGDAARLGRVAREAHPA